MGDHRERDYERQERIRRQAENDDAVAAQDSEWDVMRIFVESEMPRIESEWDRERRVQEDNIR